MSWKDAWSRGLRENSPRKWEPSRRSNSVGNLSKGVYIERKSAALHGRYFSAADCSPVKI
jgi:hypothetical protein